MLKINPVKSIECKLSVPGSKYIANRVLVIAGLANGKTLLKNMPDNDDIKYAILALEKFGVKINKKGNDLEVISGRLLPPKQVFVGQSGTLFRFITAFSSLFEAEIEITGENNLLNRPIQPLLDCLNDLGAVCKKDHTVFVNGPIRGGKTMIRGDISSQFTSALLLISPYAKQDTEINITGAALSREYIDMTVKCMRNFGINVERTGDSYFKVKAGQKYKASEYEIPGDWSSANYFFAAAALIPGRVQISGLDIDSVQGEARFINVLEKMGTEIRMTRESVQVSGSGKLCGADVDMSGMPDAVQTLAVLAPFCSSTTRIRNIAHVKHKESNRLKDTAAELRKLGVSVKTTNDSMIIEPGPVKQGIVDSHNDHRMAMSFAVLGLKSGVTIKNPECVSKSFPDFWERIENV